VENKKDIYVVLKNNSCWRNKLWLWHTKEYISSSWSHIRDL